MHSSFISRTLSAAILVCASLFSSAYEGMWLPTLLKGIEGDMHTAGLRITAEDIYSVNNGSIKDAIVLFGGGCTAEVVSGQGLILTNHHCGRGNIQSHSSLENDYLKNGFWAGNKGRELRNPGLTATFIIRMEDVTEQILPLIPAGVTEVERREAVARLSEPLVREATKGTHYSAVVRPFNYGNMYYLIITETFRDVRLVGAPPTSIGNFGGDTDNWMWPRHTGDFSIFRIYAGADNKPADAADGNVPFEPRHVLPISLEGAQEGEMAMIFGFPGSTQRYLTSYAVQQVMEVQDPMRIALRTASLGIIDQAMRASDLTRIQYTAKQGSISNAWKKWIGELRGLKELDALEEKRAYEQAYRTRASELEKPEYGAALDELRDHYAAYVPYNTARDLFIEMAFYGPEVLRFADRFTNVVENHAELLANGRLDAELEKLREGIPGYFKNYDAGVDRRVFKAMLPIYRRHHAPELAPDILLEIDTRYKGNADAWVDAMYAGSVFMSQEKLEKALSGFNARKARALKADRAFQASRSFFNAFLNEVRPQHAAIGDRIEQAMRTYVKGMMELFPEKTYWPDANSTLRLSYGKVEGSEPRDAVVYGAFTTLDGLMAKYVPDDAEFDVPQRLIELYKARDHGDYGVNGTMPVCFTSSLHTTGGNSGSPVLNGRGELIGVNFDRTWESTMSDIRFDAMKCRNISVDIRYVLFIVDKFAGAGHLIEEMTMAPPSSALRTIDLPLHR